MSIQNRLRFPLLALALFAALAAMWAGLVRLGWDLPPLTETLPTSHGALMIAGFLGTLIGLERAVALNYRWTYLAPAMTALSTFALILGVPKPVPQILLTLGSVLLAILFAFIVRQHFALFTITMALGTLTWLGGNVLLVAGQDIYRLTLWWMGFLILTIVGERIEMSRLLRIPRAVYALFLGAVGVFLLGVIVSVAELELGTRIAGGGMIALALWLLRYDIATRTVKMQGLTRFIALCLLVGYAWLAVSGGIALAFGKITVGPRYDAFLHTILLGFVFSMIFGHAPIIFPAVLQVEMAYRPRFYAHLALLHLSLILRVAGDLAALDEVRMWGGMINVIAILLFLFNTTRSVRRK